MRYIIPPAQKLHILSSAHRTHGSTHLNVFVKLFLDHRSIQCNNISSFIAIVLVDVKIIAIYELWKSSEFVYYQITQLSEQKYRLAIPFAEHNFGPFGRIFFVIILFESLSKILFRVFFASLYLQSCIFYHGISISITVFPFLSHLYQATNVGLILFVHSSRRWDDRFQIKNLMLSQ
jgi:hypothetical protein